MSGRACIMSETVTPDWNAAITHAISHTWAVPAMTSQNVLRQKGQRLPMQSVENKCRLKEANHFLSPLITKK